MNAKLTTLLVAGLMLVTATPALAQSNVASHGQDSEFGSIRTPYAADMNGERVPVEAKVVLRKNYEEQESRFFMFAWTVDRTPLDVSFDSLVRSDTGKELPCYQRQGDPTTQMKCFVDLRDMPKPGTEIVMRGTVGASKVGSFQVGAIVVPFTYIWGRVQMSNGLDAELYGYTMISVHSATSGSGRIGGLGNAVPGIGTVGLLAVMGGAAVVLAARRRGS